MPKIIGIVRETKNEWERRVPLIPADIKEIIKQHAVTFIVQPSSRRIFKDAEFTANSIQISEDLSPCDLIFGIKEIKISDLIPNKTYFYFSHTIKGQSYNMAMLQRLLDLKCTLIDYERMANEQGQRLLFFSLHAGLAGIIDTLWAFGKRLEWAGITSPFQKIRQTWQYDGLGQAQAAFQNLSSEISKWGLPQAVTPLIIGITGYGNVSQGVQQLLDLLPVTEALPAELNEIRTQKKAQGNTIFKVIFKEEDMVEPISDTDKFDLQEYYDQPAKYRTKFEKYLPYLSILVNASFWDTAYPKHVTKSFLKEMFSGDHLPPLQVIGDISCDIEGGIECTLKATDPGNPIFSYDATHDRALDGFTDTGPVIMAVDNLPSELSYDASLYFSSKLKSLLPLLINADFSVSLQRLMLPDNIKNAVIVHQGKLTPSYTYLKKYL
jgi:alpha-aminoadipic semialdehyde synthase